MNTRKLLGWTLLLVGLTLAGCMEKQRATIPITTSSEEALESFLQGRELFEALQNDEARALFEKAVEQDPGFAMAHLFLARTSTGREFRDGVQRAATSVGGISTGERGIIMAAFAGVKGRKDEQLTLHRELVWSYPDDERAWTELGRVLFDEESYVEAIDSLERAVRLNSDFAPAYDLLGRAHWRTKNLDKAEAAFARMVELLPARPEPLAAHGDLLMKTGAFDASVAGYESALALDGHYGPAQVGVAHGLIFQDRSDEARKRLAGFHDAGADDDERRLALFWTAMSYVYDGDHDNALKALEQCRSLATRAGDSLAEARDLAMTGEVLLDALEFDRAQDAFAGALRALERTDEPDTVKIAARAEHSYRDIRVAIARGDRRAARIKMVRFREALKKSRDAANLMRSQELMGLFDLEAGRHNDALRRLAQADVDNPRILYLTAQVHLEAGHKDRARRFAEMAANFNAPHVEYAFVRNEARKLAAEN